MSTVGSQVFVFVSIACSLPQSWSCRACQGHTSALCSNAGTQRMRAHSYATRRKSSKSRATSLCSSACPHMLWPLPRIACMSRDLSCAQAVLDHCGLSPLTVAVNDAVATMCAIHCIPPLFPHRMPHASLSWRAGCPVEGVSNKPAAMLHTRTQAAPQRAHIE